MARSGENTGLQVALILFVIITVVLGVTTYLYFRKAEDLISEKNAFQAKLEQAEDSRDKALLQVQYLRHIVGFEVLDDVKVTQILTDSKFGIQDVPGVLEIKTNFDNARKVYGVGLDTSNLYYDTMPQQLLTTITTLNKQLADKDALIASLRDDYKKAVDTHTAVKVDLDTKLTTVQDNWVSYKNQFDTKLSDIVGARTQIKSALDKRTQEKVALQSRLDEETKTLNAQLENQGVLIETLKDKNSKLQDRSFESPDGLVTTVSTTTGRVYINLGSADGLERQVTFSVYDQDENAVAKAEQKGRIEVTDIIGPHEAVARILEDSIKNPILPRDKIFSPAWSPGRKIHFALAGIMDINDDGADDRVKVRNIITMSGGIIDAELDSAGQSTGEMTFDTTYLVRGKLPTEKSGDEYRQGYAAMISQAREMNVEVISVSKLLNIMGWKPEERTVNLGGRGGSYQLRKTGGGGGGSEFQPRRPPAANGNSAF